MTTGKIIKWVDDKGFGFIRVEGQPSDVFVHISAFGRLPRAPKVGEGVEIDVLSNDNGKVKAVRARIPGLVPLAAHKDFQASPNSWRLPRFAVAAGLLALGVGLWWGHRNINPNVNNNITQQGVEATGEPVAASSTFRCEGKTRCTEMVSKEEAQFYLQNCPEVKIDGDGDGDACEDQFGHR